MENLKEDTKFHIDSICKKYSTQVACAKIEAFTCGCDDKTLILKAGHSKDDLKKFYSEIDFDFMEAEGTIWFQDCTWSSRMEHNGTGIWYHHRMPVIPREMLPEEYQ